MKAFLKQVRISPKKVNLIAEIIRNQKALEGLEVLKYMPKKAAQIIYKVLESAVANAENNFGQNKDDLYISEVLVSGGVTYKRGQSHSKGRVTPLLKRTSNIKVELEVKGGDKDITKNKEKNVKTKKVSKES